MHERQWFLQRLRRFSRARRRLLNAALAYRLAFLGLAAGVLALLFLGGLLPGALVNLILFGILALFLLGLVIRLATRWRRFRSPLEEAFVIEGLAGDLNSRVVSSWDFVTAGPDTPLTRRVIEQARLDLQAAVETRLDRHRRNEALFRLLAMLAVFLSLSPSFGLSQVLHNAWLCWREVFHPLRYRIFPEPGPHVHRVHDQVAVGIELLGRDDVPTRLITVDGNQETQVALDGGQQRTATVSRDAEAEVRLHFDVAGRRSDAITLIFTNPPVLVNMQTELVYPAYTRLLPRSLEGVQLRLLALAGTQITLGFTFSKDLQEARLVWDDESEMPLSVVGRYATVNLLHRLPRKARLQVRDVHNLEMEAPLLIDFEVQADEKPVVLLPRHLKEDIPLLEEGVKLFGFGAQATDDFGITRVVLRWQKSTVDNPNAVQDRGEVERLISPVQPKVLVNYEKVFAGLALKPGDRISFMVEAHDNLTPRPQVAVSRRCSFFVYQEALGGLNIKELGLGAAQELGQERIPKATRATTVKAPEGLRTRENVWNQFEAPITTGTRPPTLGGEHSQATRDYFRLLSTLKDPEAQPPAKGSQKP
jgi:hypothetical protein